MGCNTSRPASSDYEEGKELGSPDDAQKSRALQAEAIRIAEEMFAATKGRRFHEFYTRLTLTSYGASCKVLTAYHRTTNKKVAVKTIPKSRKQLERQRTKVMLEVGTFRLVEDHPNAVRVLELFEGAECYYVVMECCEGGELFDHISKKQGGFTERQAAHLLRSLMLFLAHMHSKGIAHLDVKPENIMFDSEGANGVLKVLDFGSSAFVQPNEMVRNAFGTVRYASPEMANDVCGQKADIWSAGVVMYILLCGKAPFLKSNDMETLDLIKRNPRVKFPGERWAHISQAAKDCIRALLEPDPRTRPTAVEVLQLPWLKQQVPETVIRPDTLQHLRTFANQSRIRRLLLGLMADQLVGAGANQLLGQFYTLDKDFSGTLEVSELVKAAKEAIPDLSEHEINRMFEALDVDRTGTVDIKEFFAGLIQTIDEEKQTLVAQKSFTMLDKRGAGFVTKEAFMEVLIERAQAGTLRTLQPHGSGPVPGSAAGGSGPGGSGTGAVAETPGSPVGPSGPSGVGRPEGGFGSMSMSPGAAARAGLGHGDHTVLLDPSLVAELEQEFANLDANGDGVLSFEEFKAILGIQSTPEGLQLTQAQLAPPGQSTQEGPDLVATLTETLRTCTRTSTNDPGGAATAAGAHGNRRESGTGERSSTVARALSSLLIPPTHPNGRARPRMVSNSGGPAAAGNAAGHRTGSGTGAGGGSGGPALSLPTTVAVAAYSVDRAQLDLEEADLETRELLELLAPAKRSASHVARTPSVTHLNVGGANSRTVTAGPAAAPTAQQQQQQQQQAALSALLQRAADVGASRAASITQALAPGGPDPAAASATNDDSSDTAISHISKKHDSSIDAAGQESNGAISGVDSPKASAALVDPRVYAHTSPGSLETSLPPLRHAQPSPTSAQPLLSSTGVGTRNPLEEVPLSARSGGGAAPDWASAAGGGSLPPRQVSFAPHQVPDPEQRQQQQRDAVGVAAGALAESAGCMRTGAVSREVVLWDAGLEWEQGQEQEAHGFAGSPRSSLAARAARARGSLDRGSGGGVLRVSPK